MEIKLPFGGLLSYTNTSQNVSPELPVSSLANAEKIRETKVDPVEELDRDSVQEMMKRTSELMSMLDRSLKFELVDDAGLVQIQVIDSTDGRVVRKIPSDEVLKLVAHIKEKMSERVDVKA